MIRLTPRSTRTDTLFPLPTLFRSRHTVIQKRLCDDAGAAAKFDNKTAVIVRNLPSHMACQIARAWADGTYDARFGAQLLQKQARCQVFKVRSEEHTSELQSLMRSSYAVFCLKKKNNM